MTGRILSGGKSNFDNISKGIGEVFFEKAVEYSDNVFQIDALSGEQETFSSVKLRSIRVAIGLRELGITSEDIIVTCLKITMDTVIPHLAALYLGVKFAAIDPSQPKRDWRHCLGLVKPSIIFVDEDQVEKLEKCLKSLIVKPKLIVHGESKIYQNFRDLVRTQPNEESFLPRVNDNNRDTALILFSSGTSGLPKAMTLSHFSMLNSVQLFIETYDTKYFRVQLILSTYYWISSMRLLTRCFLTGTCRLLFSMFQPEQILRAIEKYKVSFCGMIPYKAQHLLRVDNIQTYDLSSVRMYISSGSCLYPEHTSQLRKMFHKGIVVNVYGCTETCGSITGYDLEKDLDYAQNNPNTVGRCIKDLQVKIIDVLSGEISNPNQPGEIWVKTPYGMSGYYNSSTTSNLDTDGFFHTGDIGYYDGNDFIYISGRSNYIFKYGLIRVIPEYWESVLQQHPSIYEAGVFGIPQGNNVWLPAACIVLKQHASVTAEEIQRFFIEAMTEEYKLDGGIRFVQEIPKTPTSKMKRGELFNAFTKATCF